MIDSLTPPERETIVNACDEDDFVTVWSAQRRVITRLGKLACAELLEAGNYGTTVWAKFKLPAEALSFRNPTSAARREAARRRALESDSASHFRDRDRAARNPSAESTR